MTGETANLVAVLKLNDQFSGPTKAASASLSGLNTKLGTSTNILGGTASKFGLVKQAIGGTSAALGGMATHLKGVITGPLGLIGLGAGLFTVAGLLKAGTEEASSFGLEVAKLSALTGLSIETTSALSAALDHFGISGDAAVRTVGMLTKNIGNIVNSKGGVAGFAATFGLSLTDAKGHLVDVNEEILRTADYFNNKSLPATEKAAALAKLYGRSWQTLIPFLTAGRVGIEEAEQAAKDLGLTLTAQNVGDLKAYRENFLTLGDATKGLQLQLGLVLIPLLSDLAKSFTRFLREGGTTKVVTAFKSLVQNAKDLGTVITGTIIPTLSGLASSAKGFWDSIPAPLRDLLFKGIVADRTIHFLFGVSPISLAKNLVGDVLGPILGQFAARGSSPANPMFVSGGLGGIPGPSGLGTIAKVALVGEAVGLILAVNEVRSSIEAGLTKQSSGNVTALQRFLATNPDSSQLNVSLDAVTAAIDKLQADPIGTALVGGPALDDLKAMRDAILSQLAWNKSHAISPDDRQALNDAGRTADASEAQLQSMRTQESAAQGQLATLKEFLGIYRKKTQDAYKFAETQFGGKGTVKGKASSDFGKFWADVVTRDFLRSDSTTYRSTANLQATIRRLEGAEKTATGANAKAIGKDLVVLKGELARRLAAVKKAVNDKNLAVSITVPVNTYVNGRLFDATISRYTPIRGVHGHGP